MVVNRLYDLEGNEFRDRVIFGNMVFQALEAQTNNTKDTNTLALRVSQYNSLAVGTNFTAQIANNQDQKKGPDCFVLGPIQLAAQISLDSGLVTVNSSLNTLADLYSTYYIDTNSSTSYFWTTNCTYAGKSCSDAPILANEFTNTSNGYWANTKHGAATLNSSGYELAGTMFNAFGYLKNGFANKENARVPIISNYLGVDQVLQSRWLYDVKLASGAIGFAADSDLLIRTDRYIDGAQETVRWMVSLGNIQNFTYLLESPQQETTPFVYVGGSSQNYTAILANLVKGSKQINIQTDEFGNFGVQEFSFGSFEPTTQTSFFTEFTTPNMTYSTIQQAAINLNFQGFGLPFRYWNQFVEGL